MGIGPSTLEFLVREHRARPLSGRVLTLGRQDVHFTQEQLLAYMKKSGIEPVAVPVTLSRKGHEAAQGIVSDDFLFKSFGCESVRALDVSDYESADIIWDLNTVGFPPGCLEAFDLIFDGGTLEHVFDVPTALRVVRMMTKPSGRILHASPTSNYVNHGYYSFSPLLFGDYYANCGFVVNSCFLQHVDRGRMRYDEGSFEEINPRARGERHVNGDVYNTFVSVTKPGGMA